MTSLFAFDRSERQRTSDSRQTGSAIVFWALLATVPTSAATQTVRFLTYNAELTRDGPGLLVRDLERLTDPGLQQTLARIAKLNPDIVALQSFDHDWQGVALHLLQQRLEDLGLTLPYALSRPPNTGQPLGFDLDRDGKIDTAKDRQGFGRFTGEGGMALLSRYPLGAALDFTPMLWRDLPDPDLPPGYFSASELDRIRLFNVGAWQVPLSLPQGEVALLVVQTSPPVFDGPEDRNGRRNADQIRFLTQRLEQLDRFVLMGGLNNDPFDGEGHAEPIRALLASPWVQDVAPQARVFSVDPNHLGPPELDTVDWGRDIGSLRVDYILPSRHWRVIAAAVEREDPPGQRIDGPAHNPVWVDLSWE